MIGTRIRAARERADVAQEIPAAEIPLSRAHFGLVERGHINLSVGTLARIAATLDTPIEELVPGLDELKQMFARS